MSKKKKIYICLVILLFIAFIIVVAYILNELNHEDDKTINNIETNDASTFKVEYEKLNDQDDSNGNKYRTINIDSNNPFKYSTANDIASRIDNKETFAVYFGYASCPYARAVIESLINVSKSYGINNIYYVDIENIRDTYKLNDENEALREVEGTEGYYKLLDKLNYILDDYKPLTYTNKRKKEVNVSIDEKRIYAPTLILVEDGIATGMATGLDDDLKNDANKELSADDILYQENQFGKVLNNIRVTTTTTTSTVSDVSSGEVCDGPSSC